MSERTLTPQQITEAKDAFDLFDTTGTGSIEQKELKIALMTLGFQTSKEDIRKVLSEIESSTDDKFNIDHPNTATNSMIGENGGEDLLSVTHWIKDSTQPKIVCAYAGKDTIVGVNQYATLQTKLDEVGLEYEYFYFQNSGHQDIDDKVEDRKATYQAFVKQIDDWCKA